MMTNMSEEEKAKLEANEVEAEVKTEAETKDDEATEGEEKPDEESKQYDEELQRERKARETAEKAAADLAFKLREKKRKDVEKEEVSEEDDDRPMTRREFLALQAESNKRLLESEAFSLASNFTSNESEKQLIFEKWKNRSFPSHIPLQEQIEECYLIANRKKILGENSELKRALKGKSGVNNNFSTTHQDEHVGSQPKLSPQDSSEMARVGFFWNSTARRFEKKLPGGKILVKDPKTKQTSIV